MPDDKALASKYDRRSFMVSENLNDEQFQSLIYFSRYFAFGGDIEELVKVSNAAKQRKTQTGE